MKNLIILCLLTTLAACSNGGGKTNAKLVILSGIGSNIAGQTGGLMIFGEGPGNFARILETNTELQLPNGAWNFYAIGWNGDASGYGGPLTDRVFEGTTKCAVIKGMNLSGGSIAVNFNLSTNGCQDTFFGTSNTKETNYEPKALLPFACAFPEGLNGHSNSNCKNSVATSYKVSIPKLKMMPKNRRD